MGVQHPRFRNEPFVPLYDRVVWLEGFSEYLFTPLKGQLAEKFFQAADNITIHKIFEWAVADAVRTEQKASINIQPAALYDPKFLDVLRRVKDNNPGLDPQNIMIEITEHGRMPLTADQARLLTLLKESGFRLALDDVDPLDASESTRLIGYAPHVDVIKFSHVTMQNARGQDANRTAKAIAGLRQHFPKAVYVMEGVRATDIDILYDFLKQSVDCIQLSRYREPTADNIPTLYAALN